MPVVLNRFCRNLSNFNKELTSAVETVAAKEKSATVIVLPAAHGGDPLRYLSKKTNASSNFFFLSGSSDFSPQSNTGN